jgi:hypothetical protein
MPPGVRWLLWRPVHAGLATLTEVHRSWSLRDVLDAHLILDAFDDAEREAHENAVAKARARGR